MAKTAIKNWQIAIIVLIAFAIFFIGNITSNTPASNVSKTSFRCDEWETANFISSNSNGFTVSSENKEFFLSNFETNGKQFHNYSTDCGKNGCAYLGLINQISYAGSLDPKIGTYTVVLIDGSDIVYRCAGKTGA